MKKRYDLLFLLTKNGESICFEYYAHTDSDTYELRMTNISIKPYQSKVRLCKSIKQLAFISNREADRLEKLGYKRSSLEMKNYQFILDYLIKH